MPQPTRNEVHIDQPLTDVAIMYLQQQSAFIASQVFPVVPVAKSSDKYFVFDKEAFLRDDMAVRPPATESAGSGFKVSNSNYRCVTFGLHKDLDNQTAADWDAPGLGSPEEKIAQFLTMQGLQKMERQWASDFFTTSVWGTDKTPTALWSDYATSDPIGDVEVGKETVCQNTGFMPNRLVLGYQVYKILKHHPDVIDRIKYAGSPGQPATVTTQALAALFEVERVVVASAVKATNVEGETAAYDFIHGKHALLCYSAPAPSKVSPSAGYTFMWTGVGDGSGTIAIASIEAPLIKAMRYEIEMAWDNVVTGSDLGYFFNGAVA